MVVMVLTVPASGDTRYFQLLGSQEQLFIHFVIIVMTRDCILCVSVCVCWGGGYPCFVFYYFSVPLYLNGLQCLKYSSKFGRYTQLNSQHRDYSGQYWKWYMSLKWLQWLHYSLPFILIKLRGEKTDKSFCPKMHSQDILLPGKPIKFMSFLSYLLQTQFALNSRLPPLK